MVLATNFHSRCLLCSETSNPPAAGPQERHVFGSCPVLTSRVRHPPHLMAKKVPCVCSECSQFKYQDEHGALKSGRIIEARYARQHMEDARRRRDREESAQKGIEGAILLSTAGKVSGSKMLCVARLKALSMADCRAGYPQLLQPQTAMSRREVNETCTSLSTYDTVRSKLTIY